MSKKNIIILIIILLFLGAVMAFLCLRSGENAWIWKAEEWSLDDSDSLKLSEPKPVDCSSLSIDECVGECVVCPPCPECSSLSCQTEEYCAEMGIDRDWYRNIKNRITNFQECVAAGNIILESYPRQCRANGKVFAESIGNELEKMDLIRLDSPRPNQEIKSPLIVEGEARGYWFFEASFPVVLVDWDGLIITTGIATAQSDWMTEDFVQFKAELEFKKPEYKNNGALILRKDNPSGLPENDDALEIPVYFK